MAIILGIIGINLTPLLASATIIGATLGFGAQLIVRDYFSGFLLTLEDQYGIGDSITIGAVSGVVEDLTLRVTRLRAIDGTVYFVANGDIRQLANTSRGLGPGRGRPHPPRVVGRRSAPGPCGH